MNNSLRVTSSLRNDSRATQPEPNRFFINPSRARAPERGERRELVLKRISLCTSRDKLNRPCVVMCQMTIYPSSWMEKGLSISRCQGIHANNGLPECRVSQYQHMRCIDWWLLDQLTNGFLCKTNGLLCVLAGKIRWWISAAVMQRRQNTSIQRSISKNRLKTVPWTTFFYSAWWLVQTKGKKQSFGWSSRFFLLGVRNPSGF